jgi:hypothetical protein
VGEWKGTGMRWRNSLPFCTTCGPGYRHRHSDSLQAGRSGDRIPVGPKISLPVQTDSGAHPVSYTMGTLSFPGVKRPGRGFDHPPPSSGEVKEKEERYLYSTSGPSWPVIGWTYLHLHDLTSVSGFATATWGTLLVVNILLITEINRGNTSELEWVFVSVDTPCAPIPHLFLGLIRVIMTSCQLSEWPPSWTCWVSLFFYKALSEIVPLFSESHE